MTFLYTSKYQDELEIRMLFLFDWQPMFNAQDKIIKHLDMFP